ncbi:hypothetical protein VTH06DRAFT_5620 [Thermothelomyces fergusii]
MVGPAALDIARTVVFLALNALAIPFGLSPGTWPRAKASRCSREFLGTVLPPDATLENVAAVREGGSYGEGEANVAYPVDPTDLPALCAVTVRVSSSSTSSFRFGLFLPDRWNSRFLVVGNGGFAGGINWIEIRAAGPRLGMASLSTDTGHNSTAIETAWARDEPEKKTDWGWRAIHGSTVLGKALVRAYYAPQRLTYSYYSGCSTGGRQGLKELQLFPDSFDGALIGAAAWWTSHLNPYIARASLYNFPTTDPKHLSTADMNLLAGEITRQCDLADGVQDGIVSSPDRCAPDLTVLLCSDEEEGAENPAASAKARCLSRAQLQTVQNVYRDWTLRPDNELLHPGLTFSSESEWPLLLGGTEPVPYGVGYVGDFLFDDDDDDDDDGPPWDWRTPFNESVVRYADEHDPGDATADDYAALWAVGERGGKVVLYHGLADGLVPTKGTGLYWNRTLDALGGPAGVEDFMRLLLVPGMGHCYGTAVDAPWNFGAAFHASRMGPAVRSVPGFEDARHDVLMALVDWVERGRPVDSIVATTWHDPTDSSSGVKRQRPICAWPRQALWDGRGDVDDAASWTCSS